MKRTGWIPGAAFALVLTGTGPALAEPLTGGGQVSEMSVAAALLTVDRTPLRLDARTRVYDYAGKVVPTSALEVGTSVRYTAVPGAAVPAPAQPDFPVAREVRMVPN